MPDSPPTLAALRRLNSGFNSIDLAEFVKTWQPDTKWLTSDDWVLFSASQLDYVSNPERPQQHVEALIALAWELGDA